MIQVRPKAKDLLEERHRLLLPESGRDNTWENQCWWQEEMRTNGGAWRSVYLKEADGYHEFMPMYTWAAASEAFVQVGIIGSRACFDQIPSCLSTAISDGIPPYRLTRIVLERSGNSEQLLIHGRSGEQILLNKMGPEWRYAGPFKLIPKDKIPVGFACPPLITMYDDYPDILKMVQGIQKAEGVITAFLSRLFPSGIISLVLGYDGYPTSQEKSMAATKRKDLQEQIASDLPLYVLPDLEQQKPSAGFRSCFKFLFGV